MGTPDRGGGHFGSLYQGSLDFGSWKRKEKEGAALPGPSSHPQARLAILPI